MMHGSSYSLFMYTALLVLLPGVAARDFDADVHSMHAPVTHLRQGPQDLGCKLRKLEAQQLLKNLDQTAVGDWFLQDGHPNPETSVYDDGFPQHGEWEMEEGGEKEETDEDELAKLTPATYLFILADGVPSVLAMFALLAGVSVVWGFLLHRLSVSDASARHSVCSHEPEQPQQEKDEEGGDIQMEPVAPEPVQPAQGRLESNGESRFRTNRSVQENLFGMEVQGRLAVTTADPNNDDHATASSPSSPPASPPAAGLTGEATPSTPKDKKRRRPTGDDDRSANRRSSRKGNPTDHFMHNSVQGQSCSKKNTTVVFYSNMNSGPTGSVKTTSRQLDLGGGCSSSEAVRLREGIVAADTAASANNTGEEEGCSSATAAAANFAANDDDEEEED